MTKKHPFLGIALAAVLAFVAGASGCDDNTDTLFTGNNCDDACSRYAACYDTNFDVNACTDRCEASLDNNTFSAEVSDSCLDCIGDSACNTPTYTCSAACNAIIIIQ
jgi:hypothetical protein